MALVSVPPVLFPAWPQLGGIGTGGSFGYALDAVGEGAASILMPPRTGNIRNIGFRIAAASSPVLTLDVGVYTVDSSGLPTTTAFGGMTAYSVSSGLTASAYISGDLGVDCTISDLTVPIAVVARVSARTSGTVSVELSAMTNNGGVPYTARSNGTWTKATPGCSFVIKYDDGSVYHVPGTLVSGNGSQAFLANGNARGLKLQVPFACRVVGLWGAHFPSTARSHSIVLYDDADNILATSTRTTGIYMGVVNGIIQSPVVPVSLTANQTVRVVHLCADASGLDLYTIQFPHVDAITQALGNGFSSTLQNTSRTGAGAWTDAALTSSGSPMLGLLIDQVDVGGGASGMLVHPGMAGGMRA